jgi:hypothetical protein
MFGQPIGVPRVTVGKTIDAVAHWLHMSAPLLATPRILRIERSGQCGIQSSVDLTEGNTQVGLSFRMDKAMPPPHPELQSLLEGKRYATTGDLFRRTPFSGQLATEVECRPNVHVDMVVESRCGRD